MPYCVNRSEQTKADHDMLNSVHSYNFGNHTVFYESIECCWLMSPEGVSAELGFCPSERGEGPGALKAGVDDVWETKAVAANVVHGFVGAVCPVDPFGLAVFCESIHCTSERGEGPGLLNLALSRCPLVRWRMQ